MNLRDFEYLAAVAHHLHFGNAARACHVSQPTLSMQLKKLEEYLGVQLFERTNKSVMLTRTGQDILARARQALEASHAIREIARQTKEPLSGELRLGVFPTLGPYLLPWLVPRVSAAMPRLSLLLVEEKTPILLEQLQSGEIDCALLALPVEAPGLIAQPVIIEPFLLAVPTHHALAVQGRVSLSDLRGQSVLLLEEGHCLRAQALEVCQSIGAGEASRFRATSLETLRHMVAAGSAITLMPKLATATPTEGLRYLPFSKPAPSRHIALVWRETSARSEVFQRLCSILKGLKP